MSDGMAVRERSIFEVQLTGGLVAAILAVGGVALLLLTQTAVLFVAALALLVAAFVLAPALGLAALAFVLPFWLQGRGLGQVAFSPPELVLLCAIVGMAVRFGGERVLARAGVGDKLRRYGFPPLDMPIALFLAAALLSLLASEVLRVSLRELRTVVLEPVAAYYLAAHLLRERQDVVRVTVALLLGGLVAASLGIYQYFLTDHVIAVEGVRRILGPYSSPNELGLYLGRILPIATAIALYLPSVRWPAALVTAASAGALLLTYSLGAWLAAALALLVVVMLWLRNSKMPAWAGTVLVASVIAVFVAAALSLIGNERITSHFTVSQGTSFIRLQLWESAIRMIRDHPVFGVGLDNFLYLYRTDYLPAGGLEEPNLSHPHNLVLNFWLQMGILGLAAWLWLLVALGLTWIRLWRAASGSGERAMLAGIAGAATDLVAHGMVDNSYFLVDLAFQFWLLVALLVWLARRAASETSSDATSSGPPWVSRRAQIR